MELLGVIFVLIGLLALILSSVTLIISIIKNQKSKLVSGLMLLTSIVLMSIGAVIMSMDAPSNKQQATKEESPIEIDDSSAEDVNTDTEEETPITNDENEVSANDAEREYYLNEVAPALDKLMNDFDDTWTNHWQVPFDKLGRSEISLSEVRENLDRLDKKYYDLRETLDSLNPDSLSEENTNDFKQYKEKFMSTITGRMFVADNTINAIDQGTLDDTHVSNSLAMIEMADEDLFAALTHWTMIKQRLDLSDE